MLRSHGIVAFAPTADRAIALTERFDDVVRARLGPLPPFDASPYLEPAELAFDGGAARMIPTRPMAAGAPRYLFPDAPVCASTLHVDTLADPAAIASRALAALGRACIAVDPAGKRLAIAKNALQLRQTCEVLAAHDWIEDVLSARGTAQYLPDDEPAGILSLPSEQYRIRLAEIEAR